MSARIRTGRFRWRLTIVFILVSGFSAGILATGSFFLARQARLDSFLERSLRDTHINQSIARAELDPLDRSEISRFLRTIEAQTVATTILVSDAGAFSSGSVIDADDLPADLPPDASDDAARDFPYVETVVNGKTYLVVAAPGPSGAELFFFYPRTSLNESMNDLAAILIRLWIGVVAVSALVGSILARQTLAPVARASEAARSLAEGILDTRLPVEREDEFGSWAVSFNEMADALQEKIEQLTRARERERQFTSDVAHELRTPLTALVTSTSMLQAGLDDMHPDMQWAAERMVGEVHRLRSLVEELLEISSLHAGRQSVVTELVDLDGLLEAIVAARRWDDSITMDVQPVTVETDKRRLERILANLMGNALRHGGSGVCVRVGVRSGSVFVEVADAGPGISPEHAERIFDRFYKVDPARPGGSGLGLSIALENAHLLGGSIELDSEPGRGTTFTLLLPGARRSSRPIARALRR